MKKNEENALNEVNVEKAEDANAAIETNAQSDVNAGLCLEERSVGKQISSDEIENEAFGIYEALKPFRLDFQRTRTLIEGYLADRDPDHLVVKFDLYSGRRTTCSYYEEAMGYFLDDIEADETFAYAAAILNERFYQIPLSAADVREEKILKALSDNLNLYPLNTLDDYLRFPMNYDQYDQLVRENYWENDNDLYFKYFNRVYELFDQLRNLTPSVTRMQDFIQTQVFDSDWMAYWTWKFIIQLIESYPAASEQLKRCRRDLSREVARLEQRVFPKQEAQSQPTFVSPICLNKKKGFKINFIRVVNVLIELGFFIGVNGERITKKTVFHLLAILLNDPTLENYDKDLSNSMQNSNAAGKQIVIFDEMKQKHQEIYNSK